MRHILRRAVVGACLAFAAVAGEAAPSMLTMLAPDATQEFRRRAYRRLLKRNPGMRYRSRRRR